MSASIESGHFTIQTIDTDTAGFYDDHVVELAETGAAAFGQDPERFMPQVAARFSAAKLAQVFYAPEGIAGFALYDMLRSRHWRSTLN